MMFEEYFTNDIKLILIFLVSGLTIIASFMIAFWLERKVDVSEE